MGRDNFQYPRLLQALSKLSLDGWGSFSGQSVPGPHGHLGHCCTGTRTPLRPKGSCNWTLSFAKAKAVTFSYRCQSLSSFPWKLSQPSTARTLWSQEQPSEEQITGNRCQISTFDPLSRSQHVSGFTQEKG